MSRKLLSVLLLALLASVATSARSQSPAVASRTIVVEDALVTLIDDNRVPASELGMITAMHVKELQSVEKGETLAEIDNRETLAKKRIALGEQEAAETQAKSDAELDVAKKAVLVAQAELDSANEIIKKQPAAVPLTELRKLQFQLDRALAQVRQAEVEKLIAEKTAAVKKAQVDATDIELDRRQLKSPFKGEVVEIIKKVGDWAQPGDSVIHIMGLDRLRVRGFVLATQASPAEVKGKPATILVYGAGNKQYTLKGVVTYARPEVELRQFRVWVDVDNEKIIDPITKIESWKIEPGVTANVTIDLNPPPPPRPVAPPKAAPGKTAVTTPAAGVAKGAAPTTDGAKTDGAKTDGAKSDAGKGGGSFVLPKVELFKPAVTEKVRDR